MSYHEKVFTSVPSSTDVESESKTLLAGLPMGGVGLGYAIGADPLAVLLHTPLGVVCAVTAIGLQLAGLAWSARITRLDHQLPI